MSAVIPLPTAAATTVLQTRRRGRWPKCVASLADVRWNQTIRQRREQEAQERNAKIREADTLSEEYSRAAVEWLRYANLLRKEGVGMNAVSPAPTFAPEIQELTDIAGRLNREGLSGVLGIARTALQFYPKGKPCSATQGGKA